MSQEEGVKVAHTADRETGLSYLVAVLWMKFFDWEFDGSNRPKLKKFVLIAAPHTSNWDLPFMLGCSYLSGMRLSWLGKHTLFRGMGKPFFEWLGGVPVDRTAARGMVHQVVEVFEARESLALAIPPEGTRAKTDGWKTGFYYIALEAGVPIVPTFLDWGKRRAWFGEPFWPTGDIDADFAHFRELYSGVTGKIPEWQGEVKIREQRDYVAPPKERGPLGLVVDAYRSMRDPHSKKAS